MLLNPRPYHQTLLQGKSVLVPAPFVTTLNERHCTLYSRSHPKSLIPHITRHTMPPHSSRPQQYINVNILLPLKSHVPPLRLFFFASVEQELHSRNTPARARCLLTISLTRRQPTSGAILVAQHATIHFTRANTSETLLRLGN